MNMNFDNLSTSELKKAARQIQALERKQKELEAALASITTVEDIEAEEVEWLVPHWIPKGEITLLAGDGGVGKTSIWCRIVSDISQGKPCFLEDPDEEQGKANQRCMFFSSEDNVSPRLKGQFENYYAYEKNLLTIDRTPENAEILRRLKLGSDELRLFIITHKPALCVFDPIQAFLPDGMNMNSRNGIRKCMEALATLGKNYGTAFLLVCHTNKRDSSAGRNRISNSADLWDAARSVIMVGKTNIRLEGHPEIPELRYISNEKNNYAPLQPTILFSSRENGRIQFEGLSARHEADFLKDQRKKKAPLSKLEECKQTILSLLESTEDGKMSTAELDSLLKDEGFSATTIKRAKSALSSAGKISYSRVGFGEGSEHITQLN